MLFQIALGLLLMSGTVLVAGLTVWLLESALQTHGAWFVRGRPGLRLMAGVMAVTVWALLTITAGVWLWATTFLRLGAFTTLEESLYFSLVSFTTLGYGDVLLPKELRILGALAGVNGMLSIGVLTAMIIDTIRVLRQKQGRAAPLA